jgi:hypothetical protein
LTVIGHTAEAAEAFLARPAAEQMPGDLRGEFLRHAALVASGDFDEDEHPRGEGGRFVKKGEAERPDPTAMVSEELAVPGWKVSESTPRDYAVHRLVTGGMDAAKAEQVADLSRYPTNDVTVWETPDAHVAVSFHGSAEIPPEQQAEFVRVADELQRENPTDQYVMIEVVPAREATVADGGATLATSVEMSASVFDDPDRSLLFSDTEPLLPPDVTTADYVLTHEYGHVLDFDRHGDYWDHIPPHLDAAVRTGDPPPSRYAQQDPFEAYAEAFTYHRLVPPEHHNAFVRALADGEGWS